MSIRRSCLILLSLILLAPFAIADPLIGARPGDLIFREGNEAVSDIVLAMDEGHFSHVGLLTQREGEWAVIHSTPAEVEGRIDGVVIDSLDFFVSPQRSRHHAIYRVDASATQREQAIQWAQAQENTPFSLLDPEGIYCTTLVWEAWQAAGVDLEARFTHLAIPLAEGDFLLPSGLLSSPRLTLLETPPPTE
ncbi:YiiX/YebB-like N1pC/P60 family cysteine hydrolase [Vreelandella sp. GE22]